MRSNERSASTRALCLQSALLNRVSLSFCIHGVMTTRAERQGRNESLFREVNERIAELNQTFQVEGRSEFLCECAQEECREPVSISLEEYEEVRRSPIRFFLLPGHEDKSV